MTSIDRVKSLVSKHNGFQSRTRYKVILPNISFGNDVVSLDAFCRSVSFPGKMMNTFEKRTNQKTIKIPSSYTVDPINMQFNETNDNVVNRYFDLWQSLIVSPYDYLVEYRDFYARNVFVLKMNQQDEVTYGVLLKKAWPMTKTLIDYSDAAMNTFQEQPVTFDYEDYEIIDHSLTGVLNQVIARTRAASLFGVQVSNAITIGRTLANII